MTTDVTRLWLLDFDRCLGDVDKLIDDLFEMIAAKHELVRDWATVEHSYQEGLPVDFLNQVRKGMDEERWQMVLTLFGERAMLYGSESVREMGATRFLDWLEKQGEDYAIVSYGQSDWQQAKIRRAGLANLPYQIVDTPEKGKLVADWYATEEQVYLRPKMTHDAHLVAKYKKIILVDDKPQAFNGLPKGCGGYLVNKNPHVLASRTVIRVDQIDDIIAQEA